MEHHKDIKQINSLSELPYYQGLEDWVNEYYKVKLTKRNQKNNRK